MIKFSPSNWPVNAPDYWSREGYEYQQLLTRKALIAEVNTIHWLIKHTNPLALVVAARLAEIVDHPDADYIRGVVTDNALIIKYANGREKTIHRDGNTVRKLNEEATTPRTFFIETDAYGDKIDIQGLKNFKTDILRGPYQLKNHRQNIDIPDSAPGNATYICEHDYEFAPEYAGNCPQPKRCRKCGWLDLWGYTGELLPRDVRVGR